jgi:hypothetical protein
MEKLLGPTQEYKQKFCDEFELIDPFFSPESLVRFVKKKEEP